MTNETIYINFTGGIISPGYLKEVLEIAAEAKVKTVRFGLRQQLILDVPARQVHSFTEACAVKNIECFRKEDAHPNIVSSYPAVDIFTTDTWVREGVYKDIFNQFDFVPKIKINICDANQSLVPFFTGHVNWISSPHTHYWYLYVRFTKTEKVYCFRDLIYTNDLAAVSKQLEIILASKEVSNLEELYQRLKNRIQYIAKPIEKVLELPKFSLPYYEGFNRHNNTYWLGIYRREENFPVSLMIHFCVNCMNTKIGQFYTTPWKSIIIKGIEAKDRNLWDYVLGKYRINVRHAANELNWQVEDNCEDGLQIKRQVIRYFDKEDVRTYGLSFGVKTRPFSIIPGSIIIQRQEVKNPGRLKALERFEILYTPDFNPNSSTLISFRKDLQKEHVPTYLVSLCKRFYERQSEEKAGMIENINDSFTKVEDEMPTKYLHQCPHCFTVYDQAFGDPENNIPAATCFEDLPSTYNCPLCEAPKHDFVLVSETALSL